MNNNYNNTQSAQGLRTFILTLSVSLIIFSVVYYLMSDSQTVNKDAQAVTQETLTANTMSEEESTVFGKIASTTPDASARAVLAGTTTSPTSTGTTSVTTTTKQTTTAAVPNGGITQLTWGFVISLLSFALGFVVISKNPRSLAMSFFERKMLKEDN